MNPNHSFIVAQKANCSLAPLEHLNAFPLSDLDGVEKSGNAQKEVREQ